MIHLVLLRNAGEMCQNVNQGLDQDFRAVMQCLTQLETQQLSTNHGWPTSPHLHLPPPRRFRSFVDLKSLSARRYLEENPYWSAGLLGCPWHVEAAARGHLSPALAKGVCVARVFIRARSAPQVFCPQPALPRAEEVTPHSHPSAKSCKCRNLMQDGKMVDNS